MGRTLWCLNKVFKIFNKLRYGGEGLGINVIVEQMLKDKNIAKEICNVCKNSSEDYFYNHYDGELAEHNLLDYCFRAKYNRLARDILKQVVRYCGEKSLSARFFGNSSHCHKRILEHVVTILRIVH